MDIKSEDLFRLYRQHDKLVRRRRAKPILCNACNLALITVFGPDDELRLKCFSCGTLITPGLKDIGAVKKAVDNE